MSEVRSRILGLGGYLPSRVVTNHDLAEMMDTSHDWIVERSGIEQRRWVAPDEGNADMGLKAARAALEDAQLEAEQIDCIIYATLSPDHYFPGCGVFIQRELGAGNIPAFDIRQQCSGFVYGLQMADAFIRAGNYKNVLLIGAEVHSRALDKTTRGRTVSVLFGDGAGAAIIGRSEDPERGILATSMHSQGKDAEALWMGYPGMAPEYGNFVSKEGLEQGLQYPTMEGQKVFKAAVKRMPEVVNEALAQVGMDISSVDMLIPHQANLRINEMVGKLLRIAPEKVHNNIQTLGNTTAATIPLCLQDAIKQGKVQDGNVVCATAFGAGFTWGSVIMRW